MSIDEVVKREGLWPYSECYASSTGVPSGLWSGKMIGINVLRLRGRKRFVGGEGNSHGGGLGIFPAEKSS